MKNYYEILQVDKNATFEVINRVYKYHIKKNHPDLFEGKEKENAKRRVQNFNEAYEILSNEEKRKEYDENLKNELEIENFNIESIKRLEEENNRLQNQLIYKDQLLKDILNELNIPYTSQIKEFLNEDKNNNIFDNFDSEKDGNTSKRYAQYAKITFFKILLLIIIFIILTFIVSKLKGENYIDLFSILFFNSK